MANIFAKRQTHVYDSAKNAAEFLAYIYQLTLDPSQPIQALCQIKRPATVRQKFSYARHFISEQDGPDGDPLFAPFAALASQVKIVVQVEYPNIVNIQAGEWFNQHLSQLPATVIFSYLHAVDTWMNSNIQSPHAKRWNPPLPEAYVRTVEQFAKLRIGRITASSIGPDICVFCKN